VSAGVKATGGVGSSALIEPASGGPSRCGFRRTAEPPHRHRTGRAGARRHRNRGGAFNRLIQEAAMPCGGLNHRSVQLRQVDDKAVVSSVHASMDAPPSRKSVMARRRLVNHGLHIGVGPGVSPSPMAPQTAPTAASRANHQYDPPTPVISQCGLRTRRQFTPSHTHQGPEIGILWPSRSDGAATAC
jgi:hypothetical protein